ncbi:MAG TPA: AAA family ATPase [Candidatus Syntrophoarchaeum butanivorans]|uniref:AAA family ATPase n=1 Tax=Candidatus Syntropharchaeum butanivorans TaxID=1839936 RepID=A0A1F2P4S4_9EURY|nr:MAG: ATPase AAA [Candidatus Syntrophoarchaeum butanivorans]RJS72465.1 MAG: AAA family ATPase [Candidatus Syntrophoarchaeum sp. WYZ-LMO15]HEC57866.1 AAA family ATPase [Candidatus Syntrophoarchaeum butanivorans]
MLIEEEKYLRIIETSRIKGQEDVYLKAMRYINLGYPILFFGPPGCGKTSIARHILNSLERDYLAIEAHEGMTEYHVIGGFHPLSMSASREVAEEFMYKDGVVVRALMHGKNLLIDELTRAPSSAFSSIFLLLSHGVLTLEHREIVLKKPDDWVLIATANFGDVGSFKLSGALKRRFIPIYVSYPKRFVEEELIRTYAPSLSDEITHAILDFAEETRRMWREEGALPQGLSTDGLIKMARYCELLIREGIDEKTAFSDAAFHQGVVIADETDQVSIQLVSELALNLARDL